LDDSEKEDSFDVRVGLRGADVAIIEGVMGVFDGIDGKSEIASTSELAKMLKAPVITGH